MNLIEAANDIENVKDDVLLAILNGQLPQDDPNARFPSVVAMAEVERRTQVRKSDQAQLAAMEQPKESVAENVANNYFAGMNPQSMMMSPEDSVASPEEIMMNLQNSVMNNQMAGIPSEVDSMVNENVNPPSGLRQDIVMPETMQMAAGGGLVGYQEGGPTEERGIFGNISDAAGGVVDYVKENPLQAASIGLMFIPGIGLASAGIKGLQGLNALSKTKSLGGLAKKGIQSTFSRPIKGLEQARGYRGQRPATKKMTAKEYAETKFGEKLTPKQVAEKLTKKEKEDIIAGRYDTKLDAGRVFPEGSPQFQMGQNLRADGKGVLEKGAREYSPLRAGTTAAIGGTGLMMLGQPDDPKSNDSIDDPSPSLAPAPNLDPIPEQKGLSQQQGLDIAKLGGIVLGSRNMTDLGEGITKLAENISDRRSTEGLSEAQKALYEVQTDKMQTDIDNLPIDQLEASLKFQQKLLEQEAITDDPVKYAEALSTYQALYERYNELIGVVTPNEAKSATARLGLNPNASITDSAI